jgi:ACS family glucarate transporter-like MFS transporter
MHDGGRGRSEIPSPPSRYFRQRWLMLGLIFLVYSVAVADRTTMSVSGSSIMKDLHLNSLQLGLIFSASGWGMGLFAVPAGMLVDKFGSKAAMTGGILAWSAAAALASFSGLMPVVVPFLFVSRMIAGAAESIVTPGSANVLASWFPDRERGRASSLWASATYIGLAATAPLIGWVCHVWGWKPAFWIICGASVAVVCFWRGIYHAPSVHPRIHADELSYIAAGGALVHREEAPADAGSGAPKPRGLSVTFGRMAQLLRRPDMLAIFFGQFCGNTVATFVLGWLPVYLVKEKGVSIMQAGFMLAIPGIAGAIGVIGSGSLVDFIYRKTGSLAVSRKIPLTMGYLLCSTIMLFKYSHSNLTIVVLMTLALLGKGSANLGWTLITDVAPRGLVGTAGGLMNVIGTLGSVFTAIAIGAIVQATGSFDLALVYVGLHGILAIIGFWIFLPKMTRVVLD